MNEESQPQAKHLDHAVAGGLAWTVGAKWLTQLLTWAGVLISARLLSPSDFGLSEMAGYFGGIANILAEFGLGTVVLQIRELDRRAVAQLNTISVMLCTVAFLVAAACSPLVAMFFHSDKLLPLVIVNSTALFITGFQAVPLGLLQKDMDYRRLSIGEATLVIVQSITTVTCAWFGLGYWSLVTGALAGKTAAAIQAIRWRPTPFAIPRWRDINAALHLAWHVTVGRVAWALYTQSDGIIIGRVMGESMLGPYRIAINMAAAPAEKITYLIMRVAGPLFARVQKDLPMVRRYFLIVTELLAISIFPLTFGLMVVAPDFIVAVLGPQWAAAAQPMRWLAVYMGLRTMHSLMTQVLTSLRHTRFTMWTSLLNFVLLPLCFLVASRWGAAAVAAVWVIMSPVTIGPALEKVLRAVQLRRRDYLESLLPSLVATGVMVMAVLALRTWVPLQGYRPIVRLAIQVSAGGAVYGALMLTVFRHRVVRYVRFVQQLRKQRAVPATVET